MSSSILYLMNNFPCEGEPVGPVNLSLANTTTNSSLQAVCPLDSSLSIENVSLSLAKPNLTSQQRIKKIKLGGSLPHCKCLCQYNVTLSELQEAIAQLQKEKSGKMKTKEKPTWMFTFRQGLPVTASDS